jgi:hypothetical protein
MNYPVPNWGIGLLFADGIFNRINHIRSGSTRYGTLSTIERLIELSQEGNKKIKTENILIEVRSQYFKQR